MNDYDPNAPASLGLAIGGLPHRPQDDSMDNLITKDPEDAPPGRAEVRRHIHVGMFLQRIGRVPTVRELEQAGFSKPAAYVMRHDCADVLGVSVPNHKRCRGPRPRRK